MNESYCLPSPTLHWGDDGVPRSGEFDDVYFDKHCGIEETRYVFLQQNHLRERWQSLTARHFRIAETGFGTGLNFLCAWEEWFEFAPENCVLEFFSVEKYPLTREMLAESLAIWPQIKAFSKELIEHYPVNCKGMHRLSLANGRIQLTLWLGDAIEGLTALNGEIDAWFLDGFAPSKNPEMWQPLLFEQIKRLSAQNCSFATFTAAGVVKRGLREQGFQIRKVKGFGHKREMLVGELSDTQTPFTQRMCHGLPWFNVRPVDNLDTTRVLVVGGGLAGCHTAAALAKRGVGVDIWEKKSELAAGASGNPQGMLYPKLAVQDTPVNRFYLAAFQFAHTELSKHPEKNLWQPCGLEQRPTSEAESQRFVQLLDTRLYPEAIICAGSSPGRLSLPLAGWVRPQLLCQTLVESPKIQIQLNTELLKIEKETVDGKDFWKATNSREQSSHYSHVVFCHAWDTLNLPLLPPLPTRKIRGQVSSAKVGTTVNLSQVLCQEGYVSPPLEGLLHFGATYGLNDSNESVTTEDHQQNLAKLAQLLPDVPDRLDKSQLDGRVSFRCTVADYAPIVGPVPDVSAWEQAYQPLRHNAKWQSERITEAIPGLYLNIGHGSRGLVSTPLSGEYLASLILGDISPLEYSIQNVIHPARFLIRNLKRNQPVS